MLYCISLWGVLIILSTSCLPPLYFDVKIYMTHVFTLTLCIALRCITSWSLVSLSWWVNSLWFYPSPCPCQHFRIKKSINPPNDTLSQYIDISTKYISVNKLLFLGGTLQRLSLLKNVKNLQTYSLISTILTLQDLLRTPPATLLLTTRWRQSSATQAMNTAPLMNVEKSSLLEGLNFNLNNLFSPKNIQ